MEKADIERRFERRQILLKMANDNFPGEVEKYEDEPFGVQKWFIAIERKNKEGIVRVCLAPVSIPLMTDRDNGFEIIFEKAIDKAKEIIAGPKFIDGYCQLKIELERDKIIVASFKMGA